jgi:hypothetical protein
VVLIDKVEELRVERLQLPQDVGERGWNMSR